MLKGGNTKMEEIKVTASGNFENKKAWSGIKKHLEHDTKINHKNDYLNTAESKKLRQYNQHKILINYHDFVNSAFGSYVKEHDKNLKDKKHAYGSVDRFLKVDSTGKQRKLQPAQVYVEKFADEENYQKILQQLEKTLMKMQYPGQNTTLTQEQAHDEALKAVANGLEQYADGFNDRNPNLKMFEYYTHLDEKGAPHLHARVMPFCASTGRTKGGKLKKPSWSLNKALQAQYGGTSKDNKQRLSRFRKQEDEALISSMNTAFENYLGKDKLKLFRKTDSKKVATGLNHEEYIAKKKNDVVLGMLIAQNQDTLKQQNKDIDQNNIVLSAQKNTQKANDDKLKKQAEKITKNDKKLNNQNAIITSNNKLIVSQEAYLKEQEGKIKSYFERAKKLKQDFSKIMDKFSKFMLRQVKTLLTVTTDKNIRNDLQLNELPDSLRLVADETEDALNKSKIMLKENTQCTNSKQQRSKEEDDLEL